MPRNRQNPKRGRGQGRGKAPISVRPSMADTEYAENIMEAAEEVYAKIGRDDPQAFREAMLDMLAKRFERDDITNGVAWVITDNNYHELRDIVDEFAPEESREDSIPNSTMSDDALLRQFDIRKQYMDENLSLESPDIKALRFVADDMSSIVSELKQRGFDTSDLDIPTLPKQTPHYSFVDSYAKTMEDAERDFKDIPKAFLKGDIALGGVGRDMVIIGTFQDEMFEDRFATSALSRAMYKMKGDTVKEILNKLSTKDDESMPEDDARSALESLGFTNIQPMVQEHTSGKGMSNVIAAVGPDGQAWLFDSKPHGTALGTYSFRSGKRIIPDMPESRRWVNASFRTIGAMARIDQLTGDKRFVTNVMSLHSGNIDESIASRDMFRAEILPTIEKLGASQERSKNIELQRKYMNNLTRGSVARAFESKLHPDKEHVEFASHTSLRRDFKLIEADNDTEIEQLQDFEDEYNKIRHLLPRGEEGTEQPTLRIRKLGKHNGKNFTVEGLFFPHASCICLSENTSGSFIHEYGHYLDLIAKQNASLGSGFSQIASAYRKALARTEAERQDYYGAPTEIFARCFEKYSHDVLGIRGTRLLDESKFDGPEFAAFEDDGFRQTVYEFFGNMFPAPIE